jgi:hypothetical protein
LYYALFRMPIFVFVVYQAVYFFNPPKRWWGKSVIDFDYSFYAVVVMALLVLIHWKKSSLNKLFSVPQTKWILLFLGMHFLAYFYAASPIKHDIFTIYFAKLVIIIFLAYKLVNTKKDLFYIIYGYLFSAWYLSFYVFQIGRNRGDRVEGIGTVDSPDSNGIAAALAPAIIFGIYYLWRLDNWKYKIGALGILAFLCNAIILINSRGAVLGILCGAAFFMYELYKAKIKGKFQKATVIWLCILGLVGLSVVVDQTFIDRFSSVKEESQEVNTESETGSTRVIFWMAALELAKDHPMGTGAYGFQSYASIYIPEDTFVGQMLRKDGGVKSVHSSWFSTLAEVGFLGFIFLVMILVTCFKSLRAIKLKLLQEHNLHEYYLIASIQGALITFMVTMSFLDRHRAEILFWLILFVMTAHNVYLNKVNK